MNRHPERQSPPQTGRERRAGCVAGRKPIRSAVRDDGDVAEHFAHPALPPDDARALLLSHLSQPKPDSESIDVISSLNRILADDIIAPHPLPDFQRTTVDGYAVRAQDTFGASDSLPAYLTLIGEVPMGDTPAFEIGAGPGDAEDFVVGPGR